MASRWRTSVVGALLACAALVTGPASCTGDGDDDPKQCTKIQAAFELTVRAVSGPLPGDTKILVSYAGGDETYSFDGTQQLEVVLCDEETPDAGDAGGGAGKEVTAVHCKLWTQAAAKVTVSGGAYPTVTREVDAVTDGPCFKTVPVEIVLGDQDASS